jgi:hypothetical protein
MRTPTVPAKTAIRPHSPPRYDSAAQLADIAVRRCFGASPPPRISRAMSE